MDQASERAIDILANATRRHLGEHPVTQSVLQLADDPTETNMISTQGVFDKLPGEDRIGVRDIAEAQARKAVSKLHRRTDASRTDLGSMMENSIN